MPQGDIPMKGKGRALKMAIRWKHYSQEAFKKGNKLRE
jgi:hypothetical protein